VELSRLFSDVLPQVLRIRFIIDTAVCQPTKVGRTPLRALFERRTDHLRRRPDSNNSLKIDRTASRSGKAYQCQQPPAIFGRNGSRRRRSSGLKREPQRRLSVNPAVHDFLKRS